MVFFGLKLILVEFWLDYHSCHFLNYNIPFVGCIQLYPRVMVFLWYIDAGVMEISLLKALLNNISSFFHLSSCENINSEPVLKYYQRAEEILKLLKTILDAIIDAEAASNEVLKKSFEELGCFIDDLREQFVNSHPLSSIVYFVSYKLLFDCSSSIGMIFLTYSFKAAVKIDLIVTPSPWLVYVA